MRLAGIGIAARILHRLQAGSYKENKRRLLAGA
jgi:hypothetical protein